MALKTPRRFKTISLTAFVYLLIIAGFVVLVNACNKTGSSISESEAMEMIAPGVDGSADETAVLTVAGVERSEDSNTYEATFYERAQVFTLDAIKDKALIVQLQEALSSKQLMLVTTSPYKGTILKVISASAPQVEAYNMIVKKDISYAAVTAKEYDPNDSPDEIDEQRLPLQANSDLTAIIPDLPTAKIMFNYITQQSCNLPGPFGIDHCIPFQFVGDGCYARAHKMGWIIMNKYHYSFFKVFSYGKLSVRANKWGGCCVSWWYHVAPLVQVKTTSGIKSYVIDPGMFDQPVLLSDWLNTQKDKGCRATASVKYYNIQPPSSYQPFYNTDPYYILTDSTLVAYSHLITCP